VTYPASTRQEICRRLADGESLRKICSSEGMPSKWTVLEWLAKDEEFAAQYARARELQAELYLDEIIAISDDSALDTEIDPETGAERTNHEVVARAKLRVDTRKWAMSKMAPKKYGDKIQNEHTGPNGGAIKIQSARDLTDDELAAIAATSGK
jgi:hypothetical protein